MDLECIFSFLIKDGKNVFESSQNHGELSQEAYYFIGGLLAHSKEMALITNPIVNSYKRLVPGYDAPTELTWTENNQNSLVRIPVTRGEGIRVELRVRILQRIHMLFWQSAWQQDWMELKIRSPQRNHRTSRQRVSRQNIFRQR